MTNTLPKLAIVGRPNVGKSALFNRICKQNIAIVDEAEGITRDRLYAKGELFGFPFQVIDTGGIDARSLAVFNEEVKRQAEIAIEEADTIIMVVDSTVGLTTLDKEVAQILLRTKKPICLAVNKIDNSSDEYKIYEFQKLGITRMIAVSASQSWHIAELLEEAFKDFKRDLSEGLEEHSTHVALVGRPNVGKSSLINYLLEDERCIVSPIPGTTRDSIDIDFLYGEDAYTLIDTAGIRRKHAESEVVDKFAFIRTERAIERSHICLLMLDAQTGITTQEKKIANMIEEAGKGCILLLNKWDLVKGFRMEHCLKSIYDEVPFLRHCPKLFISALTGRNVDKIFPIVKEVREASQKRISTHQLNKFIESALQKNHPPMLGGKRLRIYYMAQVEVMPPRFILFVNDPHLMVDSYKKYLYNQFRETYGFPGVPILMHLKGKEKKSVNERMEEKAHHLKEDDESEFDLLSADQEEYSSQEGEDTDDDSWNS